MNEKNLISAIQEKVGTTSSRTVLGIGDDTAIVNPTRHPMLVCTDAMTEGVHFDLGYCTAVDIGHKAISACLSDIVAMNGCARFALFSLAVPTESTQFVDGFYEGACAVAKRFNVDIIGGDLSGSKSGVFIDVTCIGESEFPIRRSGACPGDIIAVSGVPGTSVAGLNILSSWKNTVTARIDNSSSPAIPLKFDISKIKACYRQFITAHLRPKPRFDLIDKLGQYPRGFCTSLIDLSDGLASELNHIAQKSNVSLEIDCDKIPTQPEMLNLSLDINSNCLSDALTTLSDWQLFGGEDYQLLATFDPKILEATGSLPGDFKVIGRVLQKSAAPFGSIEPSESPIVMLLTSDGKCRPLKTEKIFNHFGSPTSR